MHESLLVGKLKEREHWAVLGIDGCKILKSVFVSHTVHCNVTVPHNPAKCKVSKFMVPSACFEPEGSSSGRRVYITLWYSVVLCVLGL